LNTDGNQCILITNDKRHSVGRKKKIEAQLHQQCTARAKEILSQNPVPLEMKSGYACIENKAQKQKAKRDMLMTERNSPAVKKFA